MNIAVSHPGKIGDLLFSLPTVKYLSELHQCKVDFYTSPYCRDALGLIASQPYVRRAEVLEDYVMEHFLWGAQPWQMPVPIDQYDTVYQLGFRAFPDRHTVAYTAHQIGLPDPDPDSFSLRIKNTGVIGARSLQPPYVVVTTLSATGGGALTWAWANDKVSDFVGICPHPVYVVGLESEWRNYRCAEKLIGLPGLSFTEIGEVMKGAKAVVTFSTGLGVVAAGVLNGTNVPLVCLFDGEIAWEIFRLPGALTCSPEQDLSSMVLRTRDQSQLEQEIARLERDRRARGKELARLTDELANLTADGDRLRDALTAQTSRAEGHSQTLHGRNLEVDDLRRTLRARDVTLDGVQRALEAEAAKAEEFSQTLHRQNIDVAELRATIQARDVRLDEVQRALERQSAQTEEFSATLHTRNLEVVDLRESIHTRDVRVDEVQRALEAQVEAHQARGREIESFQRALDASRADIIEMRLALEARGAEVADLHRTLHSRQQEIEELRRAIEELQRTIEARDLTIVELGTARDAAAKRIAEVESSRSWRWTRHLRSLGRTFSSGRR